MRKAEGQATPAPPPGNRGDGRNNRNGHCVIVTKGMLFWLA